MSKIILSVLTIVMVVFVATVAIMAIQKNRGALVFSFEDCVSAGYPVMESYPEQCKTPDGRTFTKTAVSPNPTGTWQAFGSPAMLAVNQVVVFEDGLAVTLTGINDSRCKQGVVCVWAGELAGQFSITGGSLGSLTEKFVLGTAQIREKTVGGYVISLDADKTTETVAQITVAKANMRQSGGCYIGGCSGQICSDQKDTVSTCEYKEEYACYKTAQCERQVDGTCGWTKTQELTSCLQGA